MNDIHHIEDFVYIHSGEIYITDDRKPVITVLGSCVSLVMYDRTTNTGGIFHAMFPGNKQDGNIVQPESRLPVNADYADYAFYRLLYHFKKLGINPKRTELKLFGGSSSFTGESGKQHADRQTESAGKMNIDMVKALLQKEGLHLVAEDTGGSRGRKLVFIPGTGEVFIKYLSEKQVSV